MPPVPLLELPAPDPPEPGWLAPPSAGRVPVADGVPLVEPGAPIVDWPAGPMPVLLVLLLGVVAVVLGVVTVALGVVTVVVELAVPDVVPGLAASVPVVRVVAVDWQPAASAAAATMLRIERAFMGVFLLTMRWRNR